MATQDEFERAFQSLHTALEDASKTKPAMQLPPEKASDLQRLLDQLKKGAPQ